MIRIVLSPATVPSTSGQLAASIASAIGWAPLAEVRSTRSSLTPSTLSNSSGIRASRDGTSSADSESGCTYRGPLDVGARTMPSSRRSLESVAWVTRCPEASSKRRKSSWLATSWLLIRPTIACCRTGLVLKSDPQGIDLRRMYYYAFVREYYPRRGTWRQRLCRTRVVLASDASSAL